MAEQQNSPQGQHNKSGFTVAQIEGKIKKYGLEIGLCVIFVLSAIFALIWGGAMAVWSILLCMIFAIISVLIPRSMHKVTTRALQFVYKEKITTIVVSIVGILIAIFLPLIIFAIVGLVAGKSFSLDARMEDASLERHHEEETHHEEHDHHDHTHTGT